MRNMWFYTCYCILQKGDMHPVSVKVGEKVLLPEYGGTKVVLDDKVKISFFFLVVNVCKLCDILL